MPSGFFTEKTTLAPDAALLPDVAETVIGTVFLRVKDDDDTERAADKDGVGASITVTLALPESEYVLLAAKASAA